MCHAADDHHLLRIDLGLIHDWVNQIRPVNQYHAVSHTRRLLFHKSCQ